MASTKFKPIKQPNGTTCYSGPTCRLHGSYNRQQLLINNNKPNVTPAKLTQLFLAQDVTRKEERSRTTLLDVEAFHFWRKLTPEQQEELLFYKNRGHKIVDSYQLIQQYPSLFFQFNTDTTNPYKEYYQSFSKAINKIFSNIPQYKTEPQVYYRMILPEDIKHLNIKDNLFTSSDFMPVFSNPKDIITVGRNFPDAIIQEISTQRSTIPLYKSSPIVSISDTRKELLPGDIKLQVINQLSNVEYQSGHTKMNFLVQQIIEI